MPHNVKAPEAQRTVRAWYPSRYVRTQRNITTTTGTDDVAGYSSPVEPHVCGSVSERRVRMIRERGSYVVRRPQAAPYTPDRFWSFRQAGLDALGVLLVLAFLIFILWMPAVFR